MNAKLLLTPLIIVLCIGLLIWLVYPAYTNGVNGLKEKRQQLALENDNLAKAQTKSNNVMRLSTQLDNDKENKDIIMSYVPDAQKEEEIMDNLNFIANNESLSVIDLNIKPAAEAVAVETGVTETGETATMSQVPVAKTKDLAVQISVVGTYDHIKTALEKIYRLERFNAVKTMSVKKVESADKKAAGDILQASFQLMFNFMTKQNRVVLLTEPVLDLPSFDMSVASGIKDKKNVEILKMNIDQSGRSNPFLPQ